MNKTQRFATFISFNSSLVLFILNLNNEIAEKLPIKSSSKPTMKTISTNFINYSKSTSLVPVAFLLFSTSFLIISFNFSTSLIAKILTYLLFLSDVVNTR